MSKTQFYVVAQDSQDSPVVIGPYDDQITDELYDELESLGYTILSGAAVRLSPTQARKEARN